MMVKALERRFSTYEPGGAVRLVPKGALVELSISTGEQGWVTAEISYANLLDLVAAVGDPDVDWSGAIPDE